ncbi:MAG TPA: hypothetical protein VM736_02450, partial [Gemmatimonadales bacterium]|nr:hypothetical protein [Gemmatimonadales bacterium]
GAAQAAEHPEQRRSAEREIAATRRYAFYAPRRPDELTPAERWFAETGTIVLASEPAVEAPDDATLGAAFLDLARDSGWRFGQVVTFGPALPVWRSIADALRVPLVTRKGFDPGTCPLVVAQCAQPADTAWTTITGAVAEQETGLVFVLEQSERAQVEADVIGVLVDGGGRRHRRVNVAHALSEAQHPAGRMAGRRLKTA